MYLFPLSASKIFSFSSFIVMYISIVLYSFIICTPAQVQGVS